MAGPRHCRRRRRRRHAAVHAAALLLGVAARGVEAAPAEDSAVLLRFGNVTNNNLAGKGPESEKKRGIIWSDAARLGDEVIDVIAFVSGDPGLYTSAQASRNGHRGDFGVVNLAAGSTADLTFRMFDDATTKFVQDAELYLTIHDIDSLSSGQKEVVTVSGFQSYCSSDDSEVEFSQSGDGVQLTSSSGGTDDNDPASPFDMTPEQQRRSVTFTLGKVAQFPVRFEIPGSKSDEGRDFLFSGVPMECAVKKRWRCEDDVALAGTWPKVQQEWCCRAKQLGCNVSADEVSASDNEFDCNSEPRTWSQGEQEWCCTHQKKGCNVQVDPYDCEEGLWNWKHEWADEKQSWCCEHGGVGCLEEETKSPPPETYDCQPGNINPVRRWSEQKRQWCCEHVGHGCLAADPKALEGLPPVTHCEGRETHWVECESQPTCPSCAPQDCIFSEWDEWTVGEGCTGLCERRRTIMRASNECGKPCEGTRVQTAARDETATLRSAGTVCPRTVSGACGTTGASARQRSPSPTGSASSPSRRARAASRARASGTRPGRVGTTPAQPTASCPSGATGRSVPGPAVAAGGPRCATSTSAPATAASLAPAW
ncbi:unnamed protein product [Prorocentrum cordatum]|uniref:Uncharacterized protein n=1 Tax=Prorocentrum cordatum TaxID=2364126 RepID=A0ABN9W1U1_9DINO|nr:unnamed protein product [Polarella glacialis]